MTWVDIQLVLVGLVAMLEPATLASSVLALVLGDRPLRTGFWFYLGGLGVTLAVGVLAALVLGNAAASRTSTPKTWVSVFGIIAGVLLLAYVARAVRRPVRPTCGRSGMGRLVRGTSGEDIGCTPRSWLRTSGHEADILSLLLDRVEYRRDVPVGQPTAGFSRLGK
jgi:hypothetical protein